MCCRAVFSPVRSWTTRRLITRQPRTSRRCSTIAPDAHDDWYIEYAYSPGLADPDQEAERLATIAARSSQPDLVFGNDADDMRSPGSGLDPRVNIYDLSSDSIGYAASQMELMQRTLNKMAAWED